MYYTTINYLVVINMGFPGGSDGKESACNEGDLGSIPGLGRSPGEGHGNPLQYLSLENPLDKGACGAIDHAFTGSDMTEAAYHTAHTSYL